MGTQQGKHESWPVYFLNDASLSLLPPRHDLGHFSTSPLYLSYICFPGSILVLLHLLS